MGPSLKLDPWRSQGSPSSHCLPTTVKLKERSLTQVQLTYCQAAQS